jgi:uncharacterized protein YjbI with pentapeptide repeats
VFGAVSFERAQFTGGRKPGERLGYQAAGFTDAQFTETASFTKAKFSGTTEFFNAEFSRPAWFDNVEFGGEVWFSDASFSGDANFRSAKFGTESGGTAGFHNARFGKDAVFNGAMFSFDAGFDNARFSQLANFNLALIGRIAGFGDANFGGGAAFAGTEILGSARFGRASFERAGHLGPLAVVERLDLSGASFDQPVVIEAAATEVACRGTTWHGGATLRLRYARINLERATFTVPSSVAGSDQKFVIFGGPPLLPNFYVDERAVSQRFVERRGESADLAVPVVTSLQGADAANLSLIDVDLSPCRFAGARLLDQLRLEGRCVFDRPPKGIHAALAWLPVWRWSSRQTLAEEHTWRATTRKHAGWANTEAEKLSEPEKKPSESEEKPSEPGKKPSEVGPERLAGLYRQLRKAQEDAKNEPGAADFYYGEMEMRRHSRTTPTAEHVILWLYWLISGYGLRALRSLAALVVLGVLVTTTLTGFGLAKSDLVTAPPQRLTGTISSTHKPARITAMLGGIVPPLPRASQRWTWGRIRTAGEVTLESLAFRSTDQPLTTAGVWTTTGARILGPILLALTLLAVRNRVKR